MTVRAVFFDMGGTIDTFWYSQEMRLQVTPELQSLLTDNGIDLHLTDLQLHKTITDGLARYHRWRLQTLEELPSSEVWKNYIFADYAQDFTQLGKIADDLMVWIETRYYQRTMRPEIPAILREIQNMGLKIGLISNVNSRGQVPLNLTQYGIKQYFDPIVLSSEYRRRKPDPAIFHYAARLSNTPTSECVYIGDRISRDIVGAKRAGYKLAVQIKHEFDHGENDEGAIPDFIIDTMCELPGILHKENDLNQQTKKEQLNNKILAVFFDADDVLYYRNDKDKELNAFINQYGHSRLNTNDLEIRQLRQQAYTGKISYDQYMAGLLGKCGITEPNLVYQGIERALQEKDQIHFFKKTCETLNKLRNRKLYLGIITDTAQPLHVKINKLERGGIGHLWDAITPSSEVGVQKPSPEIYQLALNQLGIQPHQAIFVGHKSSELDGAKRVGMVTVAFNYDKDAKADYYVNTFSELADLPILNY